MVFYIIAIVGGDMLIMLINLLVNQYCFQLNNWYIVLCTLLGAVIVIAIDGVVATIIRKCLPEKWFDYRTKIHTGKKWECNLYEHLGIKNWKDSVIELGMFTAFSKREIAQPGSREYVERFILECNYGELIHLLSIPLGFLTIFCFPLKYIWCFGFPCACVNAFLNLLPFMILRYNSNRLGRMRDVLEKKEKREAKK